MEYKNFGDVIAVRLERSEKLVKSLFEGNISLTAEIFLQVIGGKIERKYDEALGINKICFE